MRKSKNLEIHEQLYMSFLEVLRQNVDKTPKATICAQSVVAMARMLETIIELYKDSEHVEELLKSCLNNIKKYVLDSIILENGMKLKDK